MVIAGVEVLVATVPANPLADVTDTLVTVPYPLLLNVVQSVLDRYPFVVALDCDIDIVGVFPPEEAIGDVPDTLVTVPTDVLPPRLIGVPLIVIELLASWALLIVPLKSVVGTVREAVIVAVPFP